MHQKFFTNQEKKLSCLKQLADAVMSKTLCNDKYYILPVLQNLLSNEDEFFSKKLKAAFNQVFKEESKQILQALKRFEEKRNIQFEEYVFSLPQRMEDLKAMLEEIENYPIKSITKKLQKLCKKNNMNSEVMLSFIKKVKATVVNTVIKDAIAFETTQFNQFYAAELKRINVNYYIQNEAVKILTPNHYQKHIEIVTKAMRAYHNDMKSFLTGSRYDFTPVWNFFDYMMQHIKALQDVKLSISA